MRIGKLALACVVIVQSILLVQCQCPWAESGAKLWSNPTTWTSGVVPVAGNSVSIPSGVTVVYDVTTSGVLFSGITVPAGSKLVFDGTKDVVLETSFVNVQYGGSFLIGSSICPFTKKATITLFGPKDTVTSIVPGMGNKAIINAGTVEFFGVPPQPTWTKIATTVNVNSTSFTVQDTLTNWKIGDSIVLASTDYYHELSENLVITAISGKTITVDRKVKYLHWGANSEYAEVGSLTRNILVQGDASSDTSFFGGHCINYGNSSAKVYGVEFARLGQRNIIGRYPFHYHVMGDQIGKGHFVNESSFHHNYQRCLTIHGTSGVAIQNNVGFNVTGHCYFLEEGSETSNFFNHNLGIYATNGSAIPTDVHASIFWITNPNNTFINNAAVGGQFGFWFSLPSRPLGMTAYQTWVYPRFTPLGVFDNNVAHSAIENGIHIDDCPTATGAEEACSYTPLVPPYTASTQAYNTVPVRALFSNNFAYKNRQYGFWLRGSFFTVDQATAIDNGIGVNFPANANIIKNSLIVGETPNIGTPGFTKYFNDFGRSRPRLWNAAFPVHGFEGYDNTGNQFARNVTFVNFTSDSVRNAGAVSTLPGGIFILPPNDALTQTTLINSVPFVQDTNLNNRDGPNHVVIHDADGSLTGSYGSYIVSDNAILRYDSNCSKKPEWTGVYLCQPNENGYSYLTITNTNTANTNFSDSLTLLYRASFIPFGQPSVIANVTGGDVRNAVRNSYAANVISRKGYVIRFPHPTPPAMQLNLRYAATGEWVVIALAYPSNTNFTLTRGYGKIPLSKVASLSVLSPTTYYFDVSQQYLYVMYFEDNGSLESPTGFPQYGYGSSYVDITASCGTKCSATIFPQAIPPTFSHGEDSYKANLRGCTAGTTSPYQGKGFIQYNPQTKRVTYLIYHNIPTATVATLSGLSGVVYSFPVAQSPIRGGFSVSWNKLNELWNGNWSIMIGNGIAAHTIKGNIGCASTCTPPPLISATDPCASIANEAVIYRDALNTSVSWADWSWNTNRTFNFASDKRCGTNSFAVQYFSYGGVQLHIGLGDCVPGACTQSWQRPYMNVSSYSYFQFLTKSPAGPLQVPLSVRASDYKGVVLGPDVLVSFKYIDNFVVEDTWTRVKIPLSDLGFKGNELVGNFLILMNGNVYNYTVLYDEIRLVPAYTDPITKGPIGTVKIFSDAC